jgi:signal transduction histidine kinase
MTLTVATVFSPLIASIRLDILIWIVGIPMLLTALVLLWIQYRHSRTLKGNVTRLAKLKNHSVEYDFILKAMKLAVWRLDVPTHAVMLKSDYRDQNDSVSISSDSTIEEVYELMDPADAEMVRQGMEDLMAGRMDDLHLQYRMRIPHSDNFYWTEGFATIDKRDLQGNPLSVVGAIMRIDQQKEIEKALMDAVYHAEESDRLKSAFLANISHEIRTPLNAIVGFSDVLTLVEDEEERRKLIGLIKKNNDHLLRLFDDIVSMSKLEARGGGELNTSTFGVELVFKELITKYDLQCKEKGVPIVVEDAGSLPTLTTDRDRLREILNQYVNNALKFTSEGQVTLGCTSVGNKYRIWVRDTGKGIPEDKCDERLFERFFKVDEFVPGTGLGLSICRSLAMTLNGDVGMASTYGEGSVFWVELNK